jgi:hypothetical protein
MEPELVGAHDRLADLVGRDDVGEVDDRLHHGRARDPVDLGDLVRAQARAVHVDARWPPVRGRRDLVPRPRRRPDAGVRSG